MCVVCVCVRVRACVRAYSVDCMQLYSVFYLSIGVDVVAIIQQGRRVVKAAAQ